ncbi:tRNA uridine-5-carboxymethylaminomethyl(34) synthesis GTPase MnmE [Aureivirga marina]|uniref:tRNA uridine-5-carboxymethylaminomethyl(34) synthesis GTPase MnmE n=1 Tax=Aureivirga marina TaxID=1182451 RepID=UPI0018C931C7|nr:tRNA uridine-5-carboxymethylaminomethyl(34) synthesis GTPase MnmE [Aureivirga marina]
MIKNDSIIALATPSGIGAIAVIRISGKNAIKICNKQFQSIKNKNKDLTEAKSHTLHFGNIVDGERIIDEVLVSLFKGPNSYTGENTVEISCHGSVYIQQEIIQLFLKHGCRMADPGEFTLRAFLNGKLDLSQAEAVADLIASNSAASHQVAMQQMRGGFSSEIKQLRQELLNFASLIELELDFSEEDVEFADRTQFRELVEKIRFALKRLIDSFSLGNVLKNGIPVAIVGAPNVGKSTLLNTLLNEERAIVSNIAGTTRDVIEDEMNINGVAFRFIDTAGIRDTEDVVESIGIQKTFEKIEQAQVVLYLFDSNNALHSEERTKEIQEEILKIQEQFPNKKCIVIANKIDLVSEKEIREKFNFEHLVLLSAKTQQGVEQLTDLLLEMANTGALSNNETIVTNSRHFEALSNALEEMNNVQFGLDSDLSGDLLAIDIRQALYYLGEITGEITNDDLLGNIFANFCIGK